MLNSSANLVAGHDGWTRLRSAEKGSPAPGMAPSRQTDGCHGAGDGPPSQCTARGVEAPREEAGRETGLRLTRTEAPASGVAWSLGGILGRGGWRQSRSVTYNQHNNHNHHHSVPYPFWLKSCCRHGLRSRSQGNHHQDTWIHLKRARCFFVDDGWCKFRCSSDGGSRSGSSLGLSAPLLANFKSDLTGFVKAEFGDQFLIGVYTFVATAAFSLAATRQWVAQEPLPS